jgi:hypothetical protein
MVGRNDPCPCGSGKKYKKCCLPSDEAAARNRSKMEQTYTALLRGLAGLQAGLSRDELNYATTHFFGEEVSLRDLPQAEYLSFLDWLLFAYQTPHTGESPVALLHGQMPPGEKKETLGRWLSTHPSLYRVEAVSGAQITVLDLLTGATLDVDMTGASAQEVGTILAGRFLPVGALYRPSFDLHPGPDPERIIPLLQTELARMRRVRPDATWAEFLQERWPLVRELGSLLAVADEQGKVLKPDVIQANACQVVSAEGAPDGWQPVHDALMVAASAWTWDAKQRLARLWHDAARALQPRVVKPETWAAGVLYLYRSKIAGEVITQVQVAEAFGISAATVGQKAREIAAALDLVELDDRYADVLSPAYRERWAARMLG